VSVRVLAVLTAATLLTGCTSSGSPTTPVTTRDTTITHSSSADQDPIATGPTSVAAAPSCPFVDQNFVHYTIGMRLGRITILRSGGRTVGCRFYALQNSYLHDTEHLPGPRQPVLEITTQRYRFAVAARNAAIRLASSNRNAQQQPIGPITAVCFQTDFYPKDHGQDWACAANVDSTEVVVRSVDTTGTLSTATVTRVVLRNV
jgi:hypothetical protein